KIINEISHCLKDKAMGKTKEEQVANLIGVSLIGLEEIASTNKLNRLLNLHLACEMLRKNNRNITNYKIEDPYEFLINSRIILDANNNEDCSVSLMSFLNTDER